MRAKRLLLAAAAFCAAILPASAQFPLEIAEGATGFEIAFFLHGDFDGDGEEDVLAVSAGSPARINVLLTDRANKGFRGHAFEIDGGFSALCVAHVDDDPGADILLLDESGVHLLRWRQGGRTVPFASIPLLLPGGAPLRFWMWGSDIDGGGRQDLILPGLEADFLLLGEAPDRPVPIPVAGERELLRHGPGSFAVATRRPRVRFLFFEGEDAPGAGWLAGDGLMHAPFRNGAFGEPSVAIPVRRPRAESARDLLERRSVAIADIDGDGLPDYLETRTAVAPGAIPALRSELLLFLNRPGRGPQPDQVLLLPGVLSGGPDLRDVDGDGRPDLFLSLYGGGLGSEIGRRLSGRVQLEYLLYLGRGEETPFPRAPDVRLKDLVPVADFDVWDLRHRLLLTHDWDGDGLLDLVKVEFEGESFRAKIHRGEGSGGSFRFRDEAFARTEIERPVRKFRGAGLARGVAGLALSTGESVIHIRPERP